MVAPVVELELKCHRKPKPNCTREGSPKTGTAQSLRLHSANRIHCKKPCRSKNRDYAMFNSQMIESAQGIAEAIGIDVQRK
jgi:hypothetical protein